MPKMQRRYRVGSVYYVEGVSAYQRNLKFVGRLKMGNREYLLFKPVRKSSKFRKTH